MEKSLNDFLEGKKYLIGEKPCNEDAAVFGQICQIIYHERGPMYYYIKSKKFSFSPSILWRGTQNIEDQKYRTQKI